MKIPKMPWYGKLEQFLSPAEPYVGIALVVIATASVAIAMYGDSVTKLAWFIYLVSP